MTPSVPVYITYLNKVKQKRKLAVDAMDKLLNFFHIQDLSCPKEVVEKIAEVAQSKKWKAAFTTVDKRYSNPIIQFGMHVLSESFPGVFARLVGKSCSGWN